MQRLAALGCDPTPILHLPMWLAPLWVGVVEGAEKHRRGWGQSDAVDTVNMLGEAFDG